MSDKITSVTEESEQRGHSIFPPSGAARWMSCKASPMMSKLHGVYSSSEYAEEGTRAHSVAEQCALLLLRDRMPIPDILARVDDQELVDCMRPYLEEIESTYFETPDSWMVEGRIDLSPIYGVANQYGYADCVLAVNDELHVFDYKHGVGNSVSPVENKQLMIYAWAVLQNPKASHINLITLHIVQPRAIGEPAAKSWTCSREELKKFGVEVLLAVSECQKYIETGEAPEEAFNPSDANCQWCPAHNACTGRVRQVSAALRLPTSLPSPKDATPDQLSAILKFRKLVTDWFSDVEDETFTRITLGETVPLYKIVRGNRGIRRWKDKKQAEEVIRSMRIPVDFAYKKDLISPTRAEELNRKVKREDGKPVIGDRQWKALEDLITQNEGKPTLVGIEDKRPPMVFSQVTAEDFNDLAEEEGPGEAAAGAPV